MDACLKQHEMEEAIDGLVLRLTWFTDMLSGTKFLWPPQLESSSLCHDPSLTKSRRKPFSSSIPRQPSDPAGPISQHCQPGYPPLQIWSTI